MANGSLVQSFLIHIVIFRKELFKSSELTEVSDTWCSVLCRITLRMRYVMLRCVALRCVALRCVVLYCMR